jgi:hypothetical protein
MKVLDLACASDHVFEGWFASEDEFQAQLARGLVECPVCGDHKIQKRLSAPRLNLGHGTEPSVASAAVPMEASPPETVSLQDTMMRALREVVARTEDVGERFVGEARRMHRGEIEQRGIRGRASLDEARALLDEGISVVPLPDVPLLKETLQ